MKHHQASPTQPTKVPGFGESTGLHLRQNRWQFLLPKILQIRFGSRNDLLDIGFIRPTTFRESPAEPEAVPRNPLGASTSPLRAPFFEEKDGNLLDPWNVRLPWLAFAYEPSRGPLFPHCQQFGWLKPRKGLCPVNRTEEFRLLYPQQFPVTPCGGIPLVTLSVTIFCPRIYQSSNWKAAVRTLQLSRRI